MLGVVLITLVLGGLAGLVVTAVAVLLRAGPPAEPLARAMWMLGLAAGGTATVLAAVHLARTRA